MRVIDSVTGGIKGSGIDKQSSTGFEPNSNRGCPKKKLLSWDARCCTILFSKTDKCHVSCLLIYNYLFLSSDLTPAAMQQVFDQQVEVAKILLQRNAYMGCDRTLEQTFTIF